MVTRLRRALLHVFFPHDDDALCLPNSLLADHEGWDNNP